MPMDVVVQSKLAKMHTLCRWSLQNATAIDNNVLSGYSGVKPKKIPIADPSAMECGVSAIAINVM